MRQPIHSHDQRRCFDLRQSNRRQFNRRGYAMLIVMAVVLSTTALAAVQLRYLDSAARIQKASMESVDYSEGPLSVLAIAIDRLNSGDPPTPVSYRFDHTVNGATTTYRIDYTHVLDDWTVTADPDPTATSLPLLPTAF